MLAIITPDGFGGGGGITGTGLPVLIPDGGGITGTGLPVLAITTPDDGFVGGGITGTGLPVLAILGTVV